MAKQQPPRPSVPQFSDEEISKIKDFGQSLSGEPTDFDHEVASHLRAHEANAQKMREAQQGLAPTEMEQAQVKQQGALAQQMATQGAMKAQQAQGGMMQTPPPQAPTGPVGTTAPYPAQAGEVGPKETPETPASSGASPDEELPSGGPPGTPPGAHGGNA
jgi:hypothetical protein